LTSVPLGPCRPDGIGPGRGARFYSLIRRDVRGHYEQMVHGAAWAVVQALFMTFIFTMLFARFARPPSRGYACAALTEDTRVMAEVRK
jgi:hypothetical protein